MSTSFELFPGKNLSDIFKDIYSNQILKKKNISELIETLRKLIKNVGEAAVIAPIIKDLIEVSVKNDDHLIKLANIAQRLAASENKNLGEDGWLSDEEKRQLLNEVESTVKEIESENKEKLLDIEIELDDLKSKMK
jgi:hypothetical protein